MKHKVYGKDGKFIPVRMCVACRKNKPKTELIKISKTDDTVEINGKSGRGAYVCRDTECIKKAQKIRGLERGLKTSVSGEIYEELTDFVNQ